MGNVHTGLNERAKEDFLNDTFLPNVQACKDCWAKYSAEDLARMFRQ